MLLAMAHLNQALPVWSSVGSCVINFRSYCLDLGLFFALKAVTEEEATPTHVEMSAPHHEFTEQH